jgi:superfamily II DNA/RNA helicase
LTDTAPLTETPAPEADHAAHDPHRSERHEPLAHADAPHADALLAAHEPLPWESDATLETHGAGAAADVPVVPAADATAPDVAPFALTMPDAPADEAEARIVADAIAAEPGNEPAADEILSADGGDEPDSGDEADEAPAEAPEMVAEAPRDGFAELGLSEPILRAVAEMGYVTPTPVQAQAIPFVLMGRDVLGCAQTGTGKTAGFTLPMLDILSGSRARARMPRSLILEPTRELALQVAENFVKYGKHLKLTHALIIGGESMSDQKDLLMRGVDVLIATPGRLIDMFERGGMLLTDCRVLVIDEADRMLDMGFIPDVEKIVNLLPRNRQTLFFSATMAPEIRKLADAFLQNPKTITVSAPASVATTITTGLALVAEHDKREALRRLIRSEDVQNALIFCNRKRDVDILHKSLTRHGFSVGALHGDMAQPVRFATLEKFKANELRLLCCSDVAARGLDIGGLSHVFNFDVPIHAEDYVHRIGRTGRAGREGRAFTIAHPDERYAVEAIEKLTGVPIPRIEIPGLDVVQWAESDGRRRKGRGGKGKSAKPEKAEKPKDKIDKREKDDKRGGRGKARDGAAIVPPAPMLDLLPDSRPMPPERAPRRAPLGAIPAVAPAAPRQAPVEVKVVPEFRRPPAPPPAVPRDRDRDRDRFRRGGDGDLGPSVVGFGGEIPAFMLVAARPRRHAEPAMHAEAHHEETEADA